MYLGFIGTEIDEETTLRIVQYSATAGLSKDAVAISILMIDKYYQSLPNDEKPRPETGAFTGIRTKKALVGGYLLTLKKLGWQT
jgi:hypothetical protein